MSDPVTTPSTSPQGGRSGALRLGTRRSQLALIQSRWVAERLEKALVAAGRPAGVELVEVTTEGDRTKAPLSSLGGTGVFVSALRDALLDGSIDLAVHSLKDLPTAPAEGLVVAAVPQREDPRDLLVARDGLTLAELPAGSRIGTGSPRRAAQIRALGLGHEVVDIRGNVDSRLRKVTDGEVDAVVLARAGLLRLERAGEATEVFDPLLMLPAPGQGALAVECRADDAEVRAVLAELDDPFTRHCVVAERALLARLEAGCAAPVGALAEVVLGDDGDELSLRAVAASLDGAVTIRRSAHVPLGPAPAHQAHQAPPEPEAPPDPGTVPSSRALAPVSREEASIAEHLGRSLAEQMLEDGAADLMPVPAGTVAPRAGTGDQPGGPTERTNGRATARRAVGLASEEGL
jgi:hydroxymethylbilane synthase